ncbi:MULTISPECIES: hypothetical protein [unclassified Paenibacillus]|uniref:hypothetical protein n=1 Tax=unclassified Paenibacillus TaxID=185978 RepID=UPI001C113D9A|nr:MULTISPECIES: hypothetical protein [unclassified Paenibacillus]MBU5440958.1 hypothetical protein [Paenibacillus sp. MSJ-34]CAH0118042.1 hypothetical protein PAE9249_00507 [Paenibacillus sp. CECT 9249]
MKLMKSKPQLEYDKAKTKFEEKAKILQQKIEEVRQHKEITQEVMEEIVLETGFHDAFNSLTKAENELIDWSHRTIKHEKMYKDNREHFDRMYENLHTNPKARATIIELAMKIR